MRVVIDSNKVQTEELAQFLSASRANRAVVTDWLMMEAYKGDTLRSIYKSLGVLARFADQIVVLKNTGMCMKTPIGSQMVNRLIWREHTEGFAAFIAEVEGAREGDQLVEGSLLWRGDQADERMRQLQRGAPSLVALQEEMRSMLHPEDVDAIRGRAVPPPGILDRIAAVAQAVADAHRRELGIVPRTLRLKDTISDFLFRVGLAHVCRTLEWIRTGCQALIKPERVRNDYVDAMLSVYGTYFNGLMTGDEKLVLLHDLHRAVLATLGGRLPPAYIQARRRG